MKNQFIRNAEINKYIELHLWYVWKPGKKNWKHKKNNNRLCGSSKRKEINLTGNLLLFHKSPTILHILS